jgi:cation-transporting ATPase E
MTARSLTMAARAANREEPWPTGLRSEQVEALRRRVEVNTVPSVNSRSVASILVTNVFTRFNILIGLLLVAILVIGPIQDALFGLVLIVNTPIGIVQELRGKRALDRLAVLTSPTARVIRNGVEQRIPVAELVVGDVLELHIGDQVPVDGAVLRASGLEIDESLVTGESAPAEKNPADEVLSGSFVVAGAGLVRSARVGPAAYGNALAAEARRFAPVRSEVRRGVDRFLLIIAILVVPCGPA